MSENTTDSAFPVRHRKNQAALSRSTEHGRQVAEEHLTLGHRYKDGEIEPDRPATPNLGSAPVNR
jgi:hypothetical protein